MANGQLGGSRSIHAVDGSPLSKDHGRTDATNIRLADTRRYWRYVYFPIILDVESSCATNFHAKCFAPRGSLILHTSIQDAILTYLQSQELLDLPPQRPLQEKMEGRIILPRHRRCRRNNAACKFRRIQRGIVNLLLVLPLQVVSRHVKWHLDLVQLLLPADQTSYGHPPPGPVGLTNLQMVVR